MSFILKRIFFRCFQTFLGVSGLFFLQAPLLADAAPGPSHIVVVSSRTSDEYKLVCTSLKNELAKKGVSADYQEFWFDKIDVAGLEAQHDAIVAAKPTVLLVLGTDAALFAKRSLSNIPSVFAMVINPRDSGLVDEKGRSLPFMAGVSLDIPVKKQFAMMKDVIPGLKTIGMIYDAESKGWLKDQAQKAADELGLKLKAVGLGVPYDVESAFSNDLKDVDALWAALDPKIYNSNTAKTVLLATLRMKMPFMAFTSKYVKAGALIALECDYAGVGRQAADIVRLIIAGENPGDIGVQVPIETDSVVNTRTAQLIKLHLSDAVLKIASHVYGESES